MKRQLPLIDIAGTKFYVNVIREELQQKDSPANRISFDVFSRDRGGYIFIYDAMRKNAAPESVTIPDEKRYHRISLPALMELDTEGIALKYNIPMDVLCPELRMRDGFYEEEEDDDGEFI